MVLIYRSRMQSIPKEKIRMASEGLRAIAHELRLGVLCHLLNGSMCVAELIEATGASQSNLSQHLAKMRLMGILNNEKRGQQVYYHIANPAFAELVEALQKIYCPEMCNFVLTEDALEEK
ncbi:MAG: metalloregulator ArsR/SmtB family transcription factor [Mariprofundaceae bacterium]|nr:metalloregulator ArsR/SmtB family transcription factor [Mariprofundaceae bacterium]